MIISCLRIDLFSRAKVLCILRAVDEAGLPDVNKLWEDLTANIIVQERPEWIKSTRSRYEINIVERQVTTIAFASCRGDSTIDKCLKNKIDLYVQITQFALLNLLLSKSTTRDDHDTITLLSVHRHK